MLTPTTLALLEELQALSHAAYSEGGLTYTYVEAASQAHFRFPHSGSHSLRDEQLRELGRFLQSSQGDYAAVAPTPSFERLAQKLLAQLKADLNFDEASWSMDDGGHNMDGTLMMARRSDNRYFALELMWSID
ncbi:hypothetical protein C1O66_01670 [Paucibacter aquatile]|uniref:Uncharacterized protein n=1 Tax=Kinneretia aquatilis TaxID=2070761 RepID=A0A2N8L340_9BURK|nr:hypothetical protein [Paucibacter aquatile]PND40121.1 hypothetical protein C1O66_01670 [Paucibacter aquatile]